MSTNTVETEVDSVIRLDLSERATSRRRKFVKTYDTIQNILTWKQFSRSFKLGDTYTAHLIAIARATKSTKIQKLIDKAIGELEAWRKAETEYRELYK